MGKAEDLEQQYLDSVVAVEKQSLQVSKASKALSLMKAELNKLEEQRKQLRLQVIGEEEYKPLSNTDLNKLHSGVHWPAGVR